MTTFTQRGITRPGAPLSRQLRYESDLLFHLRAADLLLGHDATENVGKALTGEAVAAFTRASAGGQARDALGRLRQWGQGIPRLKMFDLNSDGYWETPGILLEGERENAFTKSEQLDNAAWTKTRSSCGGAAINATTAPDGTLTADKLVEDGTAAATHNVARNAPALTNDTQQSFSVFAKAAERTEIQILFRDKNNDEGTIWFDLSAGTVGTQSGAVGLIEAYADGWYRCMIMADSDAGGTSPLVSILLGSGSETETYNGDGASGAYFWGMQFEVDDAFPSSYVSTDAAAVTRSADALTYTLPFLGNAIRAWQDDYTAYARMARPIHADVTGSLGGAGNPAVMRIATSTLNVQIFYVQASRQIKLIIDTATTDVNRVVAVPSGDVIEVSVQLRNLRTGGSCSMDVGSGLVAFSGDATGASSWGDTTLQVGTIAGDSAYLALFELKVARGLRTIKQMQESI